MRNDKTVTLEQRIVIAGSPGSGKSTLARALGEHTRLPVFHMDHIHWKPGWTERSPLEKTRLVEEVIAQEKWILEGNHTATFDSRITRAQLVIFLDLAISVCLFRVVRRSIQFRNQTRPDLPADCPERLDTEMIDFLKYVWRTRQRSRMQFEYVKEQQLANLRVLQLENSRQVDAFINNPDKAST